MRNLELPAVTRVEERRGNGLSSHIEPPLEEAWPDGVKLAWHAAVVAHDAGVEVKLTTDGLKQWSRLRQRWVEPIDTYYSISLRTANGTSSYGSYRYGDAWIFLNGVRAGVEAARPR